jgi:hypothetical protein
VVRVHPAVMNSAGRGDARDFLCKEICRKGKSGTALEKWNGKGSQLVIDQEGTYPLSA